MARRRIGVGVMGAGAAMLAAAGVSEYRAAMWWSAVNLAAPDQAYATLCRGEVRVGRRGTGGFFTRAIPAAGFAIVSPWRVASDVRGRYWLPGPFRVGQTSGWTLPLYPLGGVLAAGGAAMTTRRPRMTGRCAACGYDLAGIRGGVCPECGRARAG